MMEIRFNPHPTHRPEDDEVIIQRVASIIIGNKDIFRKESGYRWQLGSGNDWKMDRDTITGEFIISYRYGHGRKKEMLALRMTIIWLLGFDSFNE